MHVYISYAYNTCIYCKQKHIFYVCLMLQDRFRETKLCLTSQHIL